MLSNQLLGARLAAGLVLLSGTLAGCSGLHSARQEPDSTPEPVAAADQPLPPDLTATEAAVQGTPAREVSAAAAPAPVDASIVKADAPKTYTVKRGDTLWGVASTFLKDPWLWPEVWYINPQVANPHLIYPGDTLALAYGADGRPQITLVDQGGGSVNGSARLDPRLRSQPLDAAIPTIPYSAIAAFLSRPSVLTADQVKHAPYVLAIRDDHVVAGMGHEVYVKNLGGEQNARFSVVHVSQALRDPENGDVLGYEGIYTATALVAKPGDPAKVTLIDTARETLRGDKVLSNDSETPLNFTLRAPPSQVRGRIISVVDGTNLIGQYQIVVINRGRRHGIEPGVVMAVDEAGDQVRDVFANGASFTRKTSGLGTSFARKVQLPDERVGTLLVFKSFDRVSYALVVHATNTIKLEDVVRNP